MSPEQQQLEAGIRALEAQRAQLGDAVVDAMPAAARAKLAALAAAPSAAQEPAQALRQVSILFFDVVGSTTLSQRLDPEAISAVMDDVLRRGTVVVEAHRGKVLQYAGDNILAAFGADGAREDDSQRAVRCGLALLEAKFVDDPRGAVAQADQLVRELLLKRGYPMADFERRAADISVDHPRVVDNYRAAQAIAVRDRTNQANTEELRKAVVHYRVLFAELLETQQPSGEVHPSQTIKASS